MFAAGESGDKHYQSALRQVEVSNEGVEALEFVAGVNEDVGPAGLGIHRTVFIGKALDRAAGGSADADDSASRTLCLGYYTRRLLRNDAKFGVHLVLLNVLRLHRAEGAEADVQRDEAFTHSLFSNLSQ